MKILRKKYRVIIIIIVGVVAIAFAYGYKQYTRELPDTDQLAPAFNLKAVELIKHFEADEAGATAQYGEKVISVQGVVDIINTTDSTGTVFLNDGSTTSAVMCQFDQKNFMKAQDLQKGTLITIKGICTGYLLDVVLIRCVIE